jgi:diguanylate cyclase (GGDEF)-like protein
MRDLRLLAPEPRRAAAPGRSTQALALVCGLLGYALVVALLRPLFGDGVFSASVVVAVVAAVAGGVRGALLGAGVLAVYDLGFFLAMNDHAGAVLPWWGLAQAGYLLVALPVGVLQDRLRRESAKRVQAEQAARFLATHDPVTELPTRLLLQDRLDMQIALARRENHGLCVLVVDLDSFKTVNDHLGHNAGDDVLREAASRMQATLRASDTVARLGGDEFIAILPAVETPEAAGIVASKILQCLQAPFTIAGQAVYVTASIGVAMFPSDGTDGVTLIKNGDLAMFRAKEQGRRSFQLFSESMTRRALGRVNVEHGLRQALEQGQLVAHFQPQADLDSGRIVGMEALLRWNHPERGVVPPNDFIPVAEETGLIVPLGEWVLEAACRQTRAWQAQGHPDLRVAVNLSVVQLRERDLADRFAAILERTGLDPRYLELEITEALVLRTDENSRDQLAKLRAMGVRLAIDDFGTGYSSLAYLTRLQVDTLKIDRSFVGELTPGSNTEAVVRAITAIARSLQLRVIAEGVETEQQRDLLAALGSHEMQGYLFSRPLPAAEATRLLAQRAHKAGNERAVEALN